jgi:transposase-like protein
MRPSFFASVSLMRTTRVRGFGSVVVRAIRYYIIAEVAALRHGGLPDGTPLGGGVWTRWLMQVVMRLHSESISLSVDAAGHTAARRSAPNTNLEGMTNWTDEARARVARGWTESALSQAAYAELHGISPRTLRDWVSRYASGEPSAERARSAIQNAIEALSEVLAALNAELAERPAEDPKLSSTPSPQNRRPSLFSDIA